MQPPTSPADLGQPLYEVFYGLREQPFALTTDPRFLFLSESHRTAFDELLTGLRRREGLQLLTGEPGTGKTTLCRAVIDALGHRTFSALILNPYMSDAEVLRVVLRDFGLVSRDEIRRGAFAKADTPQLLDTLEGFLRSLVALNSYAVVLIDEAQNLPARVIDQVRMLGTYEQDGQRLLQVVLVGQPSLLVTLQHDSLRATNDRVTRRIALAPLQTSEVDGYIRHRLSIAGGRDGVSFTPEAVEVVASLSAGLPRRVNMLCDRTLEEGRVAGTTVLKPEHVRRASRALAGAQPPGDDLALLELDATVAAPDAAAFGHTDPAPRRRRWLLVAAVVFGIAVIGAAAWGGYYAQHLIGSDTRIPSLPAAPVRNVPTIALPKMPTEEEILAIGRG